MSLQFEICLELSAQVGFRHFITHRIVTCKVKKFKKMKTKYTTMWTQIYCITIRSWQYPGLAFTHHHTGPFPVLQARVYHLPVSLHTCVIWWSQYGQRGWRPYLQTSQFITYTLRIQNNALWPISKPNHSVVSSSVFKMGHKEEILSITITYKWISKFLKHKLISFHGTQRGRLQSMGQIVTDPMFVHERDEVSFRQQIRCTSLTLIHLKTTITMIRSYWLYWKIFLRITKKYSRWKTGVYGKFAHVMKSGKKL